MNTVERLTEQLEDVYFLLDYDTAYEEYPEWPFPEDTDTDEGE